MRNGKPDRNAEILAYYETHSMKECGTQFGLHPSTVHIILHKAGIVIRPKGTRLGPEGDARRRLLRQIASLPVIATPESPRPLAPRLRTASEIIADHNLTVATRGGRMYSSAANQAARTVPTAQHANRHGGGGRSSNHEWK